jgi:hypothetical protein
MHARSYSPSLGRFLQPDPARADANLYEYAGNGPVTRVDALGTFGTLAVHGNVSWANLGFHEYSYGWWLVWHFPVRWWWVKCCVERRRFGFFFIEMWGDPAGCFKFPDWGHMPKPWPWINYHHFESALLHAGDTYRVHFWVHSSPQVWPSDFWGNAFYVK